MTKEYAAIFAGWHIQMWSILFLAGILAITIGISIAYTLANRRNIIKGN
jgi:hypothetical protein